MFEYPRARVYWNGKLHHDFWMIRPVTMLSTKKRIEYDVRFFGSFDLDEFRLYKRALSAEETLAAYNS